MAATLLLTDALAESIADAVSHGVPLETAATAAGIGVRTVYQWLEIGNTGVRHDSANITDASRAVIERFAHLVSRAQAEFEAKQIANIARTAEAVNEKTGIREWRAGAWLLNNHPRYRERYREHRQTTIEHQGTVTHEHQLVKQLEPEALEAAWQALQALPDGSENR